MAHHLSALIEAVNTADSSASLFSAVRNLAAAQSEAAIPALIAALSYNNPGAAVAAVGGLVQLGEPAVPAILEQLDLHNYTARSWAIRALAEIGDPRGLDTLLEAATSDFAVSVRRAATKGLGEIRWRWFPDSLLQEARTESLSALLHIARHDDEWVVRYAAIASLQKFPGGDREEMRPKIQIHLDKLAADEPSITVRARIHMAQEHLQTEKIEALDTTEAQPSSLTEKDWQLIREKLDIFSKKTTANSEL